MENYSESEDNSAWFNDIKNYALKHNFADNKDYKLNPKKYAGKVGDAVQVVRFAITSRLASPELYSIMKAIGKDECKKRINNLLKEEL